MPRYVWQLTLVTYAADLEAATNEVNNFLESNKVPDKGFLCRTQTQNLTHPEGQNSTYELTSEAKHFQNELKKKKRPKLCTINPKGVHEWNKEQGTNVCVHCGQHSKNVQVVKERPVKCLISGKHEYMTTDLYKFEFTCASCGKEINLKELVAMAYKTNKVEGKKRKGLYLWWISKHKVLNTIQEILYVNGKPLGRSRLKNKTITKAYNAIRAQDKDIPERYR